MSLILEALKKSESERQRQVSPGFVEVPIRLETRRSPVWIWILAILLLGNAAVLFKLYFRHETPLQSAVPRMDSVPAKSKFEPEPASPARIAPQETFSRLEERSPPPMEVVQPRPAPVFEVDKSDTAIPAATQISPVRGPEEDYSQYPSYSELIADGSLHLADLHIDIHVYSSATADRFVFINMNKYREGDQLSEGPQLHAITSDGVVLDYLGMRFSLHREEPRASEE